MSALTLASAAEDATALEAAEAQLARTAGELAGRVALLTTAAGRDPGAAERLRTGLVAFCDRELLPHATAQEAVLYPVARTMPDARLLMVSLAAEHRCIAELVDALRTAGDPADAVAHARALQVVFEEHTAKENGLVLPLLALAPGISLATLLTELHGRLAPDRPAGPDRPADGERGGTRNDVGVNDRTTRTDRTDRAAPSGKTGGCGGACGCGAADGEAVPELDVRGVPHALRHATVFGALDAVPPGRSMVLTAPHDPLPLLAQIEDRSPGVFSVEYLERGPGAWRLRIGHR
ncbi:DUF2249 domain-containing protein [Streptomyces sp. DSM 116494]|uniref:DUF2249 domain-containing protein n=1 Tax=Streptomyces okerensis TaxID=3344655 RepID=UPI00388FCF76